MIAQRSIVGRVNLTVRIRLEVLSLLVIAWNRLDSALILTSDRDQILRFNLTGTTVQPSGINIERQLTLCLILTPDTNVVNILIQEARISLVHQVFFSILLHEDQAISGICIAFSKSYIIEATIQRRVVRSDRERGCSCLAQYLRFQGSVRIIVGYTGFIISLALMSTILLFCR